MRPVPAPEAPAPQLPVDSPSEAFLRAEADAIVTHCPDHGPADQPTAWMSCHCPVADDMRRRAAAGSAVAVSGGEQQ